MIYSERKLVLDGHATSCESKTRLARLASFPLTTKTKKIAPSPAAPKTMQRVELRKADSTSSKCAKQNCTDDSFSPRHALKFQT